MGPLEAIAEKASESLLEDERLRSNLTDPEAQVLFDWAGSWLTSRVGAANDATAARRVVGSETERVRRALAAFNSLGAAPEVPPLPQAVTALESILQDNKPFTREELFRVLTAMASAAWQLRPLQ